jgi:hypothetical protein
MKNSPKNLVKVYRPHRVKMSTSSGCIFVKSSNANPTYLTNFSLNWDNWGKEA